MRIYIPWRNMMITGRPCPDHTGAEHHMASWELVWRDKPGRFERICPDHGCGHPDPAQYPIWREHGRYDLAWHECCADMCCDCCCPRPITFGET